MVKYREYNTNVEGLVILQICIRFNMQACQNEKNTVQVRNEN